MVGLGGLVGSGRTELAKSVFGVRHFHGREVRYLGAKIDGWGPARLIGRHGLPFRGPKDRGAIPPMSIRENITLASLRSVSTLGVLSTPREERQAAGLIQQLNIVARSSEQLVATFSGGNQRKCVLGSG